MPPTLVLTAKDITALRIARPTTHEVGGTLRLNKDGFVEDVRVTGGGACRDANGKLLPGKVCSVRHPTGPCVFHTHPRANRPSSGDIRNCVVHGGVHVVVTPLGVWVYRAGKRLRGEWKGWSADERRRRVLEWRFLGHQSQRDTQAGVTTGMREWMRAAGVDVRYIPYTSLPKYDAWKISLFE